MGKVIAVKKDNGMTAIIYPCPDAMGVTLIPGKPAIPAVPAKPEQKQSKTTPFIAAQAEIPEVPEQLPQVMGADGVVIPGLTEIENEDQFCARIAQAMNLKDFIVVDNDSLPNADSDFFEAWAYGPAITVDITAAKEIQRDKLRQLRVAPLAALDAAYNQADERGDMTTKTAIAAKRQALRDITTLPAITNAITTIQIRNAGLDVLAANSL